MIDIDRNGAEDIRPRICVIGVGGGGGNAVANMIRGNVPGVDFIVANTDAQALNASPAEMRIQLGRQCTSGLGAGASPEVGRQAAEESIEEISRALDGVDLCFVAAGMGGGTGTGAAPVIAAAARAKGILTVGVVTKPFAFEGQRRAKSAAQGIEALKASVDTLIVIPNQNLFRIASPDTTFRQAFSMADEVLQQGVRSITDLIMMPGIINLDFADIPAIMSGMGRAVLGTGEAEGEERALNATIAAISNPLLEGAIDGARGVIISIAGGDDLRLMEVDQVASHIRDLVDPEADIIWGSALLPELAGRVRVSIVATGLEAEVRAEATPAVKPVAVRPADIAVLKSVAAPAPRPQPAPAPAPAPVAPVAVAPAPGPVSAPIVAPIAAPAPAEPALEPAPRPASGSLFQRMAMVARGSARLEPQATQPEEEPGVYRRRAPARIRAA
ncbi:MAG TPA: cell division protein FtsZ [Allosphingosinicella sp.]|jgi:cell division protein FtsZ